MPERSGRERRRGAAGAALAQAGVRGPVLGGETPAPPRGGRRAPALGYPVSMSSLPSLSSLFLPAAPVSPGRRPPVSGRAGRAALWGLWGLGLLGACGGGTAGGAKGGGASAAPVLPAETEGGGADAGGDGGGPGGGTTGGAGGPDDSGETDSGGGDTGAPGWVVLPDSCAPPAALDGTDPFVLTGREINQSGPWFTEILDLSYLPGEGRALTAGQGGVVVFDLSDTTNPATQGHIGAGPGALERYYHVLPASSGRMWATHREAGLHLVSYEDPARLVRRVELAALGYEGLDRGGDHLYVADIDGSVDVYNVFDELVPVFTSTVEGLGRPWDVEVGTGAAYVADGALGLVALDLADPSRPTVAAAVASGGAPVRIAEDTDGTLYVAAGAGGLEVYDTTDPLLPVRVAQVDVGGSALDVAVHGGLVGVTTQEAVVLLDIGRAGSPASPLPFAYEETEQFAMAIDAADGRWVVGDWNILGVWELGPDPAPAIDLSVGVVAFLDTAETRELRVVNRGSTALDLAGIDVPPGVGARVSRASIPPGEAATLALSWDGTTPLDRDTPLCIASDDPSRTFVRLGLSSGNAGDGKALGQNAPDFALADLDGTVHRLSDQLGHPVVLAYFATW